jgi:hypothetical protein
MSHTKTHSEGSIALAKLDATDSKHIHAPGSQSWLAKAKSLFVKQQHSGASSESIHGSDATSPASEKTYLYLAYGSNLCEETFKGKRNVKPLSATNVVVPELELVFDLPGLPYTEPAFANTRFRGPPPKDSYTDNVPDDVDEKTALRVADAASPVDSLADSKATASALGWHKGLVGTVYEVTASDYQHIIATEGGGASYKDILVDCYTLVPGDEVVPVTPSGTSFKAHTLFAGKPTGKGKRVDGWAEASARYLNLITTGAKENKMPQEYREWLDKLRPYKVTTTRQKLGQRIMLATWLPWIMFMFQLQAMLADEQGVAPKWFQAITDATFKAIWLTYDIVYHPVFGDGERTIGDEFPPGTSKAKITYDERTNDERVWP